MHLPLPKAKCLETRVKNGIKWRRYKTPDGVIYTTYEVPTPVFNGIVSLSRFTPRMEAWYRGLVLKQKRALVERLLAEGWKPLAVANEVGYTEKAVTDIRRKYGNTRHGAPSRGDAETT